MDDIGCIVGIFGVNLNSCKVHSSVIPCILLVPLQVSVPYVLKGTNQESDKVLL